MSASIQTEEVPHSPLGASSSKRWLNCPGSIQLAQKMGPEDQRKSGWSADEGTAAHELAATCILHDQEPWEYAGTEILVGSSSFTVNEDMVAAVQEYVEFVRSLYEEHREKGALIRVERRLASELHKDAYGTADVTIEVPEERLIVTDYKHGIGIPVEAYDEQTCIYGYLAYENREVTKTVDHVDLYIVQPRAFHSQGSIRHYATTATALEQWFRGTVIPGMHRTEDEDAPLQIGEWCRFCPAATVCPARRRATEEMDTDKEPDFLDDDELGALIDKAENVVKYLDTLKAEALKRARNGHKVRGRKLVRKQASRIWKDGVEDALKKHYGQQAWEKPKLKTPPNIEKLPGGKDFVTRWAYKPEADLTLAPESDNRQEVRLTPDELFGDINAEAA